VVSDGSSRHIPSIGGSVIPNAVTAGLPCARAAVRGANHIERTLALPRRLPPLTCSCGRRLGAARTTFVLRCKPLWAAIAVTTVSGMRSYRATMDAAAGGARVFVPGQGRRFTRRRTASSGGHIVAPSLAPLSAAPDVELSRTPPRRWGRTHDQAITDAAMRGTGYCCTTADTAMICTRDRAIAGATAGYGCASLHVPSGDVRYQTITSGPAPIYFSGRSVAQRVLLSRRRRRHGRRVLLLCYHGRRVERDAPLNYREGLRREWLVTFSPLMQAAWRSTRTLSCRGCLHGLRGPSLRCHGCRFERRALSNYRERRRRERLVTFVLQ
jgi:hypothetical protein